MTEEQGDQIIDLLEYLLEEMGGLRSDFNELTSYNAYKMKTVVQDPTGPAGCHLGDLNDRLNEISGAISSLETTIDLK